MSSTRSFLPLVSLILTACGSAANDGVNAPGASSETATLVGSYNVTIESITSKEAAKSPRAQLSIGTPSRLDIQKNERGELEAFLTPRWGRTSRLSIEQTTKEAVELWGEVPFAQHDFFAADTWTFAALHVPRALDGSLSGTFVTDARLVERDGDYSTRFNVHASGTVVADKLAPEMRIASPPITHGGKWLPWEPIEIELAEPLSGRRLAATVEPAGEYEWPSTLADVEVTLVTGTPRASLPSAKSWQLRAPEGVTDRAGNVLAPFQGEIVFHDVGSTNDALTFDQAEQFAKWGTAERVTDARCGDSAGCMVMTPTLGGLPSSGFAGVIRPTRPVTMVRARARLLVADSSDVEQRAKYLRLPVALDVFAKGGVTATPASPLTLTRTGESTATRWTTGWIAIEAPIPEGATEIGFSFVESMCIPGCDNVDWQFVVDDVRAE